MGLKINLKPYEMIIISGAVITNGNKAISMLINNKVPILRGKDILKIENATSPASRIYFAVQLMYMDQGNLARYQELYWELVQDFIKAAPTALNLIDEINEQIYCSRYSKALKLAQKLINYEQSLISAITEP